MDYKKITEINGRIRINKEKLKIEKNYKKRQILKLKIGIDDLRIKLERLK